jgi:hypothetical protein
MVSAILLILSIIDFALAAPVLVQKKRQAGVSVVHLPKDVITVLGKRGDDDVEKLAEEYLETWGKPDDSSNAHASSSSAPQGPDHGSANVVQAPAPNPASSTANPDPLMEPSNPSSTAPKQGSFEDRFTIMRCGMTYFRIKARMDCMGHCTPQRRQSMARTMS